MLISLSSALGVRTGATSPPLSGGLDRRLHVKGIRDITPVLLHDQGFDCFNSAVKLLNSGFIG